MKTEAEEGKKEAPKPASAKKQAVKAKAGTKPPAAVP